MPSLRFHKSCSLFFILIILKTHRHFWIPKKPPINSLASLFLYCSCITSITPLPSFHTIRISSNLNACLELHACVASFSSFSVKCTKTKLLIVCLFLTFGESCSYLIPGLQVDPQWSTTLKFYLSPFLHSCHRIRWSFLSTSGFQYAK